MRKVAKEHINIIERHVYAGLRAVLMCDDHKIDLLLFKHENEERVGVMVDGIVYGNAVNETHAASKFLRKDVDTGRLEVDFATPFDALEHLDRVSDSIRVILPVLTEVNYQIDIEEIA